MELRLSRGLVTVIDDSDWPLVSRGRWYASAPRPRGVHYAMGRINGKLTYLHRVLMGEPSLTVDHINGDGLDNRRANLRLATHSQQNMNARAFGRSTFRGVSRFNDRLWRACIWDGKRQISKYATTEIVAARLYNEMARAHFGEFARPNKIEES
jgi:HNH endonuclease